MDQIKIGRFIAELRKEHGMTQLDLATKLGVTDRAVSKWENGRGLPDISLIKPLCDALSISVNELLSGQRIEKESITEKAEENIINTLDYSEKSIKKTKTVFFCILAGIAAFLILLVTFFAIDVSRMRNNKPVVFSTWGIDYFPPINLDDEKIELAIKDYLIARGDSEKKHQTGVKTFVAIKTYLIDEAEAQEKFNVYTWVLSEKCYKDKNDIMNYGSFSVPYKFIVEKKSDPYETFEVVDASSPKDSNYEEDMKKLFPKAVRREMGKIHKDGTFERLQMQINEDIVIYFSSSENADNNDYNS